MPASHTAHRPTTPRPPQVTIRPLEDRDVADVQRGVSDARVAATCNVPHPYPPDGALSWVTRVLAHNRDGNRYTVAALYDGHFAGVVDLDHLDAPAGSGELGYWIAVRHWGRGICTEAVRQVLCRAFGQMGLLHVTSRCLRSNPASARVLEKNRFRQTGTEVDQRSGSRFVGQEWLLYAIDTVDWQNANPRD